MSLILKRKSQLSSSGEESSSMNVAESAVKCDKVSSKLPATSLRAVSVSVRIQVSAEEHISLLSLILFRSSTEKLMVTTDPLKGCTEPSVS